METNKKIFISYSWSSASHIDWVLTLANRLMSDGVDVIIDKWYLKSGQDKYSFMESMVNSKDIDKVLMILDKSYSEKANSRSGGVGTETQILSPEIYNNTSQDKFIPVIAERDENGKEFMPKFLSSRIYVDLSNFEGYEENYELLLRDIYQRPLHSKPKIGKVPSFLFEENPFTHKTSFILRGFDEKVNKNPKIINALLKQFLNEFSENLKEFTLVEANNSVLEYGKAVFDNLNSYLPLRNDFVLFFEKMLSNEYEFDIDILIKFLEKLEQFKTPLDERQSWGSRSFSNFKYMIHELFLYIIALCLKYEKYNTLEELLYSDYFPPEKYSNRRSGSRFDAVFYNYIDSMDAYYKEINGREYFSSMADFMINRTPEIITKQMLVEADLFVHYISVLSSLRWFPILYIYASGRNIDVFKRLPSKRHFLKVKNVLNVNDEAELKLKLDEMRKNYQAHYFRGYDRSFEYVIPLYDIIDSANIGTVR